MESVLGRELERHEQVDHINGNGLDNRIENLRMCNNSQNQMNRRNQQNSLSKYKGVRKVQERKLNNPWYASISKDRVKFHLGYFSTEKEAAEAYNNKAKELFGEFASLNTI